MAGRGWTSELLLAKSLPNRSHHKGCVWAHESKADLGPLRFSTHERNGVGLESVLRDNFSLIFSLLNFSATLSFLLMPWDSRVSEGVNGRSLASRVP